MAVPDTVLVASVRAVADPVPYAVPIAIPNAIPDLAETTVGLRIGFPSWVRFQACRMGQSAPTVVALLQEHRGCCRQGGPGRATCARALLGKQIVYGRLWHRVAQWRLFGVAGLPDNGRLAGLPVPLQTGGALLFDGLGGLVESGRRHAIAASSGRGVAEGSPVGVHGRVKHLLEPHWRQRCVVHGRLVQLFNLVCPTLGDDLALLLGLHYWQLDLCGEAHWLGRLRELAQGP
mmetsp:Transcript_65572/g.147902  ORF Transcript_65572/g.147902 Transcript_65572/m.147902 type:complete len:233 (+) Transcript_65572:256-954(+)